MYVENIQLSEFLERNRPVNPNFLNRVRVGKVDFDVCSFDGAVTDVLSAARNRTAVGGTRLSNAWCVVVAERDSSYARLLNSPGRTLPDGTPVAFLMKYRARTSAERVRGPSFFVETLRRAQGSPEIAHFFMGSTPDTMRSLLDRVRQDYPSLNVAGSWAPPFGPVDEAFLMAARQRVAASDASIVWVGMGSPKQDVVAHEIAISLGVPAIGVGAAFDFFAGTVAEAPSWVQKMGFEWLFRLASDPRRLWKRYIVGNLQFLVIALRR